mmetsp:Transcript_126429/g.363684  ORF Transcript_126429/g.363684 Transcript_126429/m.363684 type:complete len:358 (+) Transcript_126429:28-1101(+)
MLSCGVAGRLAAAEQDRGSREQNVGAGRGVGTGKHEEGALVRGEGHVHAIAGEGRIPLGPDIPARTSAGLRQVQPRHVSKRDSKSLWDVEDVEDEGSDPSAGQRLAPQLDAVQGRPAQARFPNAHGMRAAHAKSPGAVEIEGTGRRRRFAQRRAVSELTGGWGAAAVADTEVPRRPRALGSGHLLGERRAGEFGELRDFLRRCAQTTRLVLRVTAEPAQHLRRGVVLPCAPGQGAIPHRQAAIHMAGACGGRRAGEAIDARFVWQRHRGVDALHVPGGVAGGDQRAVAELPAKDRSIARIAWPLPDLRCVHTDRRVALDQSAREAGPIMVDGQGVQVRDGGPHAVHGGGVGHVATED